MQKFIKIFKYSTPFILYVLGYVCFTQNGLYCWAPFLYAFLIIPIVELFIQPDATNLNETEENLAKSNKAYDVLLWLTVPLQYFLLFTFLTSLQQQNATIDIVGKIVGMGILCGTFGINVAHELGHRKNKFEQFLAKTLLLSSLYMHFFIEHNKGHHKHVATPDDPSTAKFKQAVYAFWIQTLVGTYKSAWQIAIQDARKNKKNKWPVLLNQMFLFQCIQIAFLFVIGWFFGVTVLSCFVIAAFIGAILLETVNYIEHYGLTRKQTSPHSYERVMPNHSWNSNHVIGRLMLFELSRHSDHHYLASRKYQILRNIDNAPQMPTGYPGMIILSLFPPLWFKIMHDQMKRFDLLPTQ